MFYELVHVINKHWFHVIIIVLHAKGYLIFYGLMILEVRITVVVVDHLSSGNITQGSPRKNI